MDNDQQIKPHSNGKELFLQNDYVVSEKPVIYSLEKEFAKTRKNKDIFFILIFGGFILALLGMSFLTIRRIDANTKKLNIGMSDLDDLQLQEKLSSIRNLESSINTKSRELNDLLDELQSKIQAVKEETRRQKDMITTDDSSNAAKEQAVQSANGTAAAKIAVLNKAYNAKIAGKRTEIDTLKEQRKKAGSNLGDAAGGDDVFNNYQKLTQIELERQKLYYESKIRAINQEHQEEIASMQSYWNRLTDAAIQKNGVISQQKEVIRRLNTQLAQQNEEVVINRSTFVIDPSNPKNVAVYISPFLHINDGDVAYVIQGQNSVAKLKLHLKNGSIRAEVLEIAKDQEVRAFDRIQLEKPNR